MTDLPTGTVTFLFTDIEGSTGLLQALGDRYAAVLDEHAAIVRRAVADGGGVEVSTHGDAFFVVFASPSGAVRAAVAAQRGLASHDWSPGPPVRVRMGVHTGEGILGGDDYVGIDVHRAARVADAAHGGQVLLSDAARGLVEHALGADASLRDLGVHRLRGITDPERLHELVIEGLASDFPAPRTLDARPSNLPLQLTSFVGREEEIAEVERLLGQTRLLTLTGPGGSGKSRLALRVAAELLPRFRDGSCFVDLSPVTDPALVPAVVANALGVPEAAGRPILDGVKDHLRHRELLQVVDNFEQVAEAGPVIEELLTAAPKLRTMVTSRVVLSVRGEQEYAVPPLHVPDPERLPTGLSALGAVEAVRLFTERALAASPRFALTEQNAPVVAEITARLDGLPLAIELAATRTKVLTPEQILSRLKRRLSILTSGPRSLPERQRTLRAAIAWSYDLLDPVERRLFARLSVFSGGWGFESAEAVCDPDRARTGRPRRADLAGRQVADPPERASRAPFALLDAGDDPGVRAGAARGRRRPRAGPAAPRRALPRPGRRGRTPPRRRRPGRVAGPLRTGARQHPRGPPLGHRPGRSRPGPGGRRGPVAVLAAARTPGRGPAVARGGPGHAVGAGAEPRPGPRPWPGRAGSPGGATGGRHAPSTTRPWPSSGSSATPPASPRPSTTRPSRWPTSTTWRRPAACSTRASSCSARSGTSPGRPGSW